MAGALAVRSRTLSSYLPEVCFTALMGTLMALWIRDSYNVWRFQPGSDWNSSEWMISYGGGFVRRGLGGTVLMAVLRYTGWSFFTTWVSAASILCLVLCGWFVRAVARLQGAAVWRAALLLNPLLFLSAAQSGIFLRKDMIFAAATLVHVWCVQRLLREPSWIRTLILVIAVGGMSSALALLHEGVFLFAWLPLNFALAAWALRSVLPGRRGATAILLAAAFLPSLAALGASVLHHGNARVAAAVYREWRPLMPSSYGARGQLPPSIGALGWPSTFAIVPSLTNARYFPLFLMAFAAAATVYVAAICILIPGSSVRRLVVLQIAPLAAALPLFLLGFDWGRWFYILGCSSFPIMIDPALFAMRRSDAAPVLSPAKLGVVRNFGLLRRSIEKEPLLLIVALLFCPMPPWPCAGGLYAFNPVILILRLGMHPMR